MLRAILGVIAGFFVTIMLVFVLFTAIYFAMGPEQAFEPGSYAVSGLWTAVAFGFEDRADADGQPGTGGHRAGAVAFDGGHDLQRSAAGANGGC